MCRVGGGKIAAEKIQFGVEMRSEIWYNIGV